MKGFTTGYHPFRYSSQEGWFLSTVGVLPSRPASGRRRHSWGGGLSHHPTFPCGGGEDGLCGQLPDNAMWAGESPTIEGGLLPMVKWVDGPRRSDEIPESPTPLGTTKLTLRFNVRRKAHPEGGNSGETLPSGQVLACPPARPEAPPPSLRPRMIGLSRDSFGICFHVARGGNTGRSPSDATTVIGAEEGSGDPSRRCLWGARN